MSKNKEKDLIQITEIKIKLKDKEISLSSEEARQVFDELFKLFELERKLSIDDRQSEYIPYPIYIERYPKPSPYWKWYPYNPITCSDTTTIKGYFGDPPNSTSCGGIGSNGQILSINLS
jgi:hypothetical protein